MAPERRDRWVGVILLAFSVAWSALVVQTVPPGFGEGPVGPRGFPLALGILLGGLSLLMIAGTFRPRAGEAADDEATAAPGLAVELWAVGWTAGSLVGYALAMQAFGFIIATALVVAAVFIFVLGKRNPALVLGMSLGMAFGIYLIFGKLLGVYLPHGSVVDLYF